MNFLQFHFTVFTNRIDWPDGVSWKSKTEFENMLLTPEALEH
jgi:hypothetical protein